MSSGFQSSSRVNNVSKRSSIRFRSALSSGSSKSVSNSDSAYAEYHYHRLPHFLHMSGKMADVKSIDYAPKAVDFFEKRSNEKAKPELVMGLHLLAAAKCKCRLGVCEEFIQILKRLLAMYSPEMGSEHAFGAFAGHM